jgi:uncharacterized protein YjeT (DUF2065 family)
MIHPSTPEIIGFWCDRAFMILAGIGFVFMGPSFWAKRVKTGLISPDQAASKTKLFRICGWGMIVCGIVIILLAPHGFLPWN